MAKYQRKTKDEFVIQGNYGCGWEDVNTEETRQAMRVSHREYCDNEPQYSHRAFKRRVKIEVQA